MFLPALGLMGHKKEMMRPEPETRTAGGNQTRAEAAHELVPQEKGAVFRS